MNEINTQTRNEMSVPDPDIALLAEAGIEAVVIWEGYDAGTTEKERSLLSSHAADCSWPGHEEGVASAA